MITPQDWRAPRISPWLGASLALHLLLGVLFWFFDGGNGGQGSQNNWVSLSPMPEAPKPKAAAPARTGAQKPPAQAPSNRFQLANAGISFPRQWIQDALDSKNTHPSQNREDDPMPGDFSLPSFPGGPKPESGMVSQGDPRFLSFYSRLTDKVRFHWQQELDQIRYSLNLLGQQKNRSYVTHVTFEFAPDGSIVDVELSQTSAMPDLDRAAMQAILKAKYLPNVPKDLLAARDANRRITFSFNVQFL